MEIRRRTWWTGGEEDVEEGVSEDREEIVGDWGN